MEELYDRMAMSIAGILSPSDKNLAIAALQCVSCALRVLKVDELAECLPEDSSGMLDLERSIVDLCGGFIVINNSGNVAMVHQTAREYLLQGSAKESPQLVDRGEANLLLFQSCMRCLMTTGLRGKIQRGDAPKLLDYAAIMWSAHLSPIPQGHAALLDTLTTFLTGQGILTWIHVLAMRQKLRVLVQASRNLFRLSKKQVVRVDSVSLRAGESPSLLQQELLDSWAVDLIKIVGKFGQILRHNPEAIYKSVAPFCPQSSAIYQHFGKTESRTLHVSGLSKEGWDDSLARLSFNFYASSIVVAGSTVAMLSTAGNVLVYDSAVFEQLSSSPIRHEERICRMELNDSATLLATYGYQNVKIWELPSGDCRWVVPSIRSKPRPLAMRFTQNCKTLLVGTDDKKVRSIDLTQATPTWDLAAELEELELEGHFLNSANCMALNRDGSLVAVAYRGFPLSAWELHGPIHIAHCWRKRDQVARGEVIEAVWHPHSPEVIGLYIEGVVFRWRP